MRRISLLLTCLATATSAGAVVIEPDDYASGSVLDEVSPWVSLSVEVSDGQGGLRISSFNVTAKEGDTAISDVSPTGDLVFAHAGVPFFPINGRILRGDFNGVTNAVSLLFAPSSTLSVQVGRLEAYDHADNLLAFDETPQLKANSNAVTIAQLAIIRPAADIAYFRAYTTVGSFGRYDALTFNTPVPYTDPADLDFDGDVDDADFGIAFANFTGPNNGPPSNPAADLDGDNDVDDADFGLALAAFTGPAGSAHVPEPTSLAVFTLIGTACIRRRRGPRPLTLQ